MGVGYNPKIVTNGLVLALDAGNIKSYPGSGTTWTDLSAVIGNGTLTNGPTFNSQNGGSVVFDGIDDTINCGLATQIGSSLTGFTISMWIFSTAAGTKLIAENGTSASTNTFYLAQEDASYFTFANYGNTGQDLLFANYTYQLNTWYNLVGTWSSGSLTSLYTNGILTNGTRTGQGAQTTLINGNTNLFIGSRAGTSFQFAGRISNVNIYTRALTAAEIQQNFNALRGRFGI